jgi:hypothetical protein
MHNYSVNYAPSPLKSALHEAGHVTIAAHAGFTVERVVVRESESFARIRTPYTFQELATHYHYHPHSTMSDLGKMLAVAIAGSLAVGEDVAGDDLGNVGLWYSAYQSVFPTGKATFLDLYGRVQGSLQSFFGRSQTRECLWELAYVLERQRELGQHALSTAMARAGITALRAPEWPVVLPPAKAAARVQPRTAQGVTPGTSASDRAYQADVAYFREQQQIWRREREQRR